MKLQLRKIYWGQLLLHLLLLLILYTINFEIDPPLTKGRFISAGLIIFSFGIIVLNLILNSFIFLYKNESKRLWFFYVPFLLWLGLLTLNLYMKSHIFLDLFKGILPIYKVDDLIYILLFIEPVVFHYYLKKKYFN
ncbi:hypothetical protein [Aureivirga sp. CE67]|uniref:hypothetical protein n=1 Tax=Aureivirga sp. CE67 TaxID=1788983 RepID=UPI0018C94022|nr:hypothetical protein [Aureivirga sp. CE67]